MPYYVDSSAMVKFVFEEKHSSELQTWITNGKHSIVISDLVRAESLRAARRTVGAGVGEMRHDLAAIPSVRLSRTIYLQAATLEPAGLRTLDAIHIAAAMSLGDVLEGMITYDQRLAEACRLNEIEVVAPT